MENGTLSVHRRISSGHGKRNAGPNRNGSAARRRESQAADHPYGNNEAPRVGRSPGEESWSIPRARTRGGPSDSPSLLAPADGFRASVEAGRAVSSKVTTATRPEKRLGSTHTGIGTGFYLNSPGGSPRLPQRCFRAERWRWKLGSIHEGFKPPPEPPGERRRLLRLSLGALGLRRGGFYVARREA